jgi:hypothetical protein
MKNNLLTTVLSWVLATSLVLSMFFVVQFFFKTRELRRHQADIARYQNTRTFAQLLLNDTLEYAKRDQGIAPALEAIGIRLTKNPAAGTGTGSGTAAPTKPAAK